MKDLDKKQKSAIEIYSLNRSKQSNSKHSILRSSEGSKPRDHSSGTKKERAAERRLNMTLFTTELSEIKNTIENPGLNTTFSDNSTPVRGNKCDMSVQYFDKNTIRSLIGNQNNSMDTKRPNSYSRPKAFISRNSTLKVSRTTKDEAMVNMVEKRLIQRLKETERSKFSSNILEQRYSIIEECLQSSICKLIFH